jgi:spermidine/putrescine transport system substrate-binding protein
MRYLLILLCLATPVSAAEIRMLTWSDYIDPEIPKQFQKQTGIEVKIDVYEETESMMAKLQAAGGDSQYDLVVVSDHAIPVLAKLGLIRKLDLAKIPNAKNVEERFRNPPYDPKGEFSLPYQWGTMGIIYRKNLAGFQPSWRSLFTPAGRFLMLDSMRDVIGAALKQTGGDVNTRDPQQLKKAMDMLLAAKKSDRFLGFDGSPSSAKKVVAGEADLAMVYNGDALNAMKEDKTNACDYVVPAEGTILWVDTMVITDKAPNADGANQFINYLLDRKVGAQLSNYINYASPNAAALPLIAEESYDEAWTAIKSR